MLPHLCLNDLLLLLSAVARWLGRPYANPRKFSPKHSLSSVLTCFAVAASQRSGLGGQQGAQSLTERLKVTPSSAIPSPLHSHACSPSRLASPRITSFHRVSFVDISRTPANLYSPSFFDTSASFLRFSYRSIITGYHERRVMCCNRSTSTCVGTIIAAIAHPSQRDSWKVSCDWQRDAPVPSFVR